METLILLIPVMTQGQSLGYKNLEKRKHEIISMIGTLRAKEHLQTPGAAGVGVRGELPMEEKKEIVDYLANCKSSPKMQCVFIEGDDGDDAMAEDVLTLNLKQ